MNDLEKALRAQIFNPEVLNVLRQHKVGSATARDIRSNLDAEEVDKKYLDGFISFLKSPLFKECFPLESQKVIALSDYFLDNERVDLADCFVKEAKFEFFSEILFNYTSDKKGWAYLNKQSPEFKTEFVEKYFKEVVQRYKETPELAKFISLLPSGLNSLDSQGFPKYFSLLGNYRNYPKTLISLINNKDYDLKLRTPKGFNLLEYALIESYDLSGAVSILKKNSRSP